MHGGVDKYIHLSEEAFSEKSVPLHTLFFMCVLQAVRCSRFLSPHST